MERYTAVKRKMDWILQLCEQTWYLSMKLQTTLIKTSLLDGFDLLNYWCIFHQCIFNVHKSRWLPILKILLHIYDYDFVWLNTHYMYVVLILLCKICWWHNLSLSKWRPCQKGVDSVEHMLRNRYWGTTPEGNTEIWRMSEDSTAKQIYYRGVNIGRRITA